MIMKVINDDKVNDEDNGDDNCICTRGGPLVGGQLIAMHCGHERHVACKAATIIVYPGVFKYHIQIEYQKIYK